MTTPVTREGKKRRSIKGIGIGIGIGNGIGNGNGNGNGLKII